MRQLAPTCANFTQVFRDGADYALHAGRPGQLECEDVYLAIKLKAAASQPPSVSFIDWMASETNRQPLPAAAEVPGVQLPLQKLCLLTPNYQLKLPDDAAKRVAVQRDAGESALPRAAGSAPPRKKPKGTKGGTIAINVRAGGGQQPAAGDEDEEGMWEE